jgi:hypothetical protein
MLKLHQTSPTFVCVRQGLYGWSNTPKGNRPRHGPTWADGGPVGSSLQREDLKTCAAAGEPGSSENMVKFFGDVGTGPNTRTVLFLYMSESEVGRG